MGAPKQAKSPNVLIYSGIALILYVSVWFMPIFGMILWEWIPLSLILLYWQRGLSTGRKGIMVALVATMSTFTIIGMPFMGVFFLFFIVIAVILGEAPAWRLKPDLALGLAAVMGTIAVGGTIMAGSAIYGFTLGEALRGISAANQQVMLQTYQEMGLDAADAARMREAVSQVFGYIAKLFIALGLVGALLTSWLNLVVGRAIMRRIYGSGEISDLGLTRWSAPEHLIWPLIASGLGVALANGFWFWLSLNLLIVLGTVYFLHGIAVMAYLMDKFRLPVLMRIVIFMVLVAQIFLALMVALTGVFDTWFDFRRLKTADSAQ
jgi:uncharacterized protein YybS (DUF2232 family)